MAAEIREVDLNRLMLMLCAVIEEERYGRPI